eukprot:GDKJ01020265.1.p1 GENE.GDKJ01020265.1~~GDKJ01020265.1.p1  ORF type:complete len:1060 (+),score=230.41 GDKJ01020265.1:34-3180(+)
MGNHLPTFNNIFPSKLKSNVHPLVNWNYYKVVNAWVTFTCHGRGSCEVDKVFFHKITGLMLFQSDPLFNSLVSPRKKTIDVLEILVGVAVTSNLSRKSKLIMIFSMFDQRQDGLLEESNFVYMIRYVLRALSRFYDVRLPPVWEIDTQARALFSILDLRRDREEAISLEKWLTLLQDVDVKRFFNNVEGNNADKINLLSPIQFDPALSMKEFFRSEISRISQEMDPDLRDAKLAHRPKAPLLEIVSVIVAALEYASLSARIIALVHNSGTLSRDLLEIAVRDKASETGDRSLDQKRSAALRTNMMYGVKNPTALPKNLVADGAPSGEESNTEFKKAMEIFTRKDAVTTIVDTKIQDFVIRCIEKEFPTLTGKVFGQETEKICAAAVKNAWLGESHAGVSIEGPASLTFSCSYIHGINDLTILPSFDEGQKFVQLRIFAFKRPATTDSSKVFVPFPLANTERLSAQAMIQGKSANVDMKGVVIDVSDVTTTSIRVEMIVTNRYIDSHGNSISISHSIAKCDVSVNTLIKGDTNVGQGALFYLSAIDPKFGTAIDMRGLSLNMSVVIAAKKRSYPSMDHYRFQPWADIIDKQVALDNCTVFLDPLDGTKLFLDKKEHCVTSVVGVCVNGEPIAGVIHYPFMGATGKTIVGIVGYGILSPHAIELFKPKLDELPFRLDSDKKQKEFDGDVLVGGGFSTSHAQEVAMNAHDRKGNANNVVRNVLTSEQLKKLNRVMDHLDGDDSSNVAEVQGSEVDLQRFEPSPLTVPSGAEGASEIIANPSMDDAAAISKNLEVASPEMSFSASQKFNSTQQAGPSASNLRNLRDDPNYDPFADDLDAFDDLDIDANTKFDYDKDLDVSGIPHFEGPPPIEKQLEGVESSKRAKMVVQFPPGMTASNYISTSRWTSRSDRLRLDKNERVAIVSDKAEDPFLMEVISEMKPAKVIAVGGAVHKLVHLMEGKGDYCVLAGTDKFDTCGSEAILRSFNGGLKNLKCQKIDYDDMRAMNNGGIIAAADNFDLNRLIKIVETMRAAGKKPQKELIAENEKKERPGF